MPKGEIRMTALTDALTALQADVVQVGKLNTSSNSATIKAAQTKLKTDVAALAAAVNPTPPPPPPPASTESPDGTVAKPGTGQIVDAKGGTWTVSADGQIVRDGTTDANTNSVVELYYKGHAVYQNAWNWWWSWNGTAWTDATDPTGSAPTPPAPGNDPAPSQSLQWIGAAGTFPTNVTPETGGGGWGNGELETYTNSPANAYCDGKGHLVIVAKADKTSARLNTTKSLQIPSGSYFECRAILPPNGWAAIWTIGMSALQGVGWPDNGEIDVVEINGGHGKTNVHVHNNAQSGWGYPTCDSGPVDGKTEDAWGCSFDGTAVKFYRNRKLTSTWTKQQALAAGGSWPFDQAVYVLLNIAIEGGDSGFTGCQATFGPINVWPINAAPALS